MAKVTVFEIDEEGALPTDLGEHLFQMVPRIGEEIIIDHEDGGRRLAVVRIIHQGTSELGDTFLPKITLYGEVN